MLGGGERLGLQLQALLPVKVLTPLSSRLSILGESFLRTEKHTEASKAGAPQKEAVVLPSIHSSRNRILHSGLP